jgi:hypothetical protein
MNTLGPSADGEKWIQDAYKMYAWDMQGGDDVRQNPYDPTQWIRQWQPDFVARKAGLTPEQLVTVGLWHLSVFVKLGAVALPEPKHHLVEIGFDGADTPTLYTVTSHVEGKSLDNIHPNSDQVVALHGLADTIKDYYAWAAATDQEFVLSDVAGLRQYKYRQPPHSAVKEACLIDVEPRVARNDFSSGDLKVELNDLTGWSEVLPPLPRTSPE